MDCPGCKKLTALLEELYEQREYNAQLCDYYNKEAKMVRAALTKIKCDLFPLIHRYTELNATIRFIDDTLTLQESITDEGEVPITLSCKCNKQSIT